MIMKQIIAVIFVVIEKKNSLNSLPSIRFFLMIILPVNHIRLRTYNSMKGTLCGWLICYWIQMKFLLKQTLSFKTFEVYIE